MMTSMKGLLAVVAISLPAPAFAQMDDAAYCRALVAKYEQYLDMSSKKGRQPQSLDARMAVAQCKSGNEAGIPGIETALHNAGFAPPSRVAIPATTTVKAPGCGVETWSTEKMTYVSTPCAGENPAGASK